MLTPRLLRTLARWVTLAAVLLASAAPALSQALAAYRGDLAPWSVVCAAGLARTDISPLSGSALVFEHCPYCTLHAGALAPPPAARVPLPSPFGQPVPAPAPGLGAALVRRSTAQPRAPPAA